MTRTVRPSQQLAAAGLTLAGVITVLFFSESATAFQPFQQRRGRQLHFLSFTRNVGVARAGSSTFPATSSLPSRLQGVIYYPDGSTEDDSASSILFEDSVPTIKRPRGLESPAWNAPLARLAAKHAPSGLDVTDIEQISIIGCTNSHCDIEAVVCEDDGCVSLSVPVALLNPCDGSEESFDDCVMENLEKLDQNLSNELAAPVASSACSEEDLLAHERMLAELQTTTTVKYPKWWHYPTDSLELAQQSESLLHILNEPDFAPDVMKLVLRHILLDPGDNLFVGEAAVVAVGPAGIIVRFTAMVREENERAKLLEMIQIPLQFETLAMSPETLRDAVLDMVEESEQA